ncbi:hypothetical protein [Chryseobacterium capnotolerans]|uniref:hypothetical protein n=1 Tax=Chryseobacterium capnotolerans TaxID=2759528 RepID=UPI001E5E86CB|nr:hypothetical protein [Chryseobacterium capnotolerans]
MPHFIIECSQDILQQRTPDEIMDAVYSVAESTGLFAVNDIKIRLQPYQYYQLGEHKKTFSMSSDTLCRDAVLNKKLIFQSKYQYGLQNYFLTFHSYQLISGNLKLQLIAIKPLSILKIKIMIDISDFDSHC